MTTSVDIKASDLATEWAKKFSGWFYPDPLSRNGAGMRAVVCPPFNATVDSNSNPYSDIKKIIKDFKAYSIHPKKMGGMSSLYRGLQHGRNGYELVEPLVIVLSGPTHPGHYEIQNYVFPTHFFWTVLDSCDRMILKKIKQINNGEKKGWSARHLLKFAEQSSENGTNVAELMHAEHLVVFSQDDAGLRFKDRQATMLAVRRREKAISSVVYKFLETA